MKINETIGIDISKETIDVCTHSKQVHSVFENSNKGIKQMSKWALKNSPFPKEEILFIFEHTGIYSHEISIGLSSLGLHFLPVPGLAIKRSLGIARGKDDKIDAAKIALYGYRLRDELIPYEMPGENIISLKRLLSLRERLVKQRAGYKTSLKEQGRVLSKKDNKVLLGAQQKMIAYLTKQIEKVEKEMESLIKEDGELDKTYKLILSIKGIGAQTARFMMAYTEAFTKFENSRKFASYCGIAPFPNSSGTSLRGKTKVSHLANKKIKSLFDLCAKSALQHSPEIKAFYERRLQEGKTKMSTINIIRNKLLARIFAVVKRGTPYVDTMKYAA